MKDHANETQRCKGNIKPQWYHQPNRDMRCPFKAKSGTDYCKIHQPSAAPAVNGEVRRAAIAIYQNNPATSSGRPMSWEDCAKVFPERIVECIADAEAALASLSRAPQVGVDADLKQRLERAEWFIASQGYRRCDIAACNCPYWHGGHLRERFDEIQDVLLDADISLNGKTLLTAIKELVQQATPHPHDAPGACAVEPTVGVYEPCVLEVKDNYPLVNGNVVVVHEDHYEELLKAANRKPTPHPAPAPQPAITQGDLKVLWLALSYCRNDNAYEKAAGVLSSLEARSKQQEG
jgi:hypothetical protein